MKSLLLAAALTVAASSALAVETTKATTHVTASKKVWAECNKANPKDHAAAKKCVSDKGAVATKTTVTKAPAASPTATETTTTTTKAH